MNRPAITYERIFNIWRAKAKAVPKISRFDNLEQLHEILAKDEDILKYSMSEEEEKLYQFTTILVKTSNGNALIIVDDAWAKMILKNADNTYFDATFGRLPRKCGYQFLTTMSEHFEEVFVNFTA